VFRTLRTRSGPAHKITIDHEVIGDDLRITLSTAGEFTTTPAVIVSEGLTTTVVPMSLRDVSTAKGTFSLRDEYSGTRTIRAEAGVNGKDVTSESELVLYSIPANRSGAFTSARPPFSISYDSGAVFRPLHFTVSTKTRDGKKIYAFEPDDILLNGGIRISLTSPEGADLARTRLYMSTRNGWQMLAPVGETRPRMVTGTLFTTLGDIALKEDASPPTLGLLRVRVSGRKPSVSFRYYDNLSGNDLDLSTVTIDDSLVIPEYDGEHRRARYRASGRLSRGRHLLRITLRDRVANSSTTERWFNVR
jgi:hypothetical protein